MGEFMMRDKKLSDEEISIAKEVGFIKMTRVFTKLFKKLCNTCRVKAYRDPKRDMGDYCSKCQDMIAIQLEKLQ